MTALNTVEDDQKRERLRWLIEELRVSLWAQTLGTAEPVSVKKLRELIGANSDTIANPNQASPAPKPPPLAVTLLPGKTKKKPLKSLNALGGLFRPPG